MGNIISESFESIGRIDDHGYIYDQGNRRIAQISETGYITEIAGGKRFGKIDRDGIILDSWNNTVGRMQADGYVIIHSERVGRISSRFIERITPDAWNAGQPSTFNGRKSTKKTEYSNNHTSSGDSFFASSFFIKIVIGEILGIVCWVNGIGGPGNLLAGPILVFFVVPVCEDVRIR